MVYNSLGQEFYKGWTIEEKRRHGDWAQFSTVTGYQANHPRGYCLNAKTKRELKKLIREFIKP